MIIRVVMPALHNPRPIAAYLKKHGISQWEFAARFGYSQSAISQWLSRKKSPSIRTAQDLQKKSAGEIKVRDLFPKFFG